MSETAERNRWDAPTGVVTTLTLIAFTALLAYINARYAMYTDTEVWLHAGIPMVVLVTVTLAELTFLSSAHGWARVVALVGFLSTFVIVLGASYMAVLSMMTKVWNAGQPWAMNAFLSAVPDTVMVVCSVTLISLRHSAHTRPAVEKAPSQSRWRRLADAATARAEAALAVPETPQVDATEVPHGGSTEAIEEVLEPSTETFVEDFAEVPSTTTEDSAKPATEPPPVATKVSAKPSAKAVPVELEPFMEAAEAMEEGGLVRGKTAEEFAKIISAVEEKWSPNRIKTELGYSTSTTEKVRAAWQQHRADRHERQLSAVG